MSAPDQLAVAIVTPVYYPAPGGGASYTKFLAEGLIARADIASVTVFSERFPGQPDLQLAGDGKMAVRRCFPYRAGRDEIDFSSYVAYCRQNLQFARIERWLPPATNVLIVHSSLHYKPNLLGRGLRRLRAVRGSSVKLVLDVRDRLLSPANASFLDLYDEIICCSKNVEAHMTGVGGGKPMRHIPIIYERPPPPDAAAVERTRRTYGVHDARYLLSTGGIVAERGVDELLDAVRELRRREGPIRLVVAGRRRNWTPRHARAEAEGVMTYVGSIAPEEIFHLMAGAEMHVNLSGIEGLPRSSLEAIASGTRAILPPNVPEFAEHCAEFVARTGDAGSLAAQMQRVLSQPKRPPDYPLERHSIASTIPLYLDLMRGTNSSATGRS